jgi:cytochrome c peroxidase
MKRTAIILTFIVSLTVLAGTIDLGNLFPYSAQTKPAYITKNNTPPNNQITDAGATLGRVLFYDKNLSVNKTIACASCHKQQFAFGDTAVQSTGLHGGLTGRHSMRLVNARFAAEGKFFWDERATSLENQTTRPIQDHVEMGFSGANGDPGLDSLLTRLSGIDYYNRLFTAVYGDPAITENRLQLALAQFVRSIQSFDSKYDIGRALVNNDGQNFPNFTVQENEGKTLFLQPPPQGGAGCQGCHQAPEFDIAPNTLNNGIVRVAGDLTGILTDFTNTRAPSLRNLVNLSGEPNGPMMHTGNFTSLLQVINHYNAITIIGGNTNLDPKLRGPGGQPQNLNFTAPQKDALVAFLKTLTGTAIYTEERWSNPFDSLGNLTILPELNSGIEEQTVAGKMSMYPNPATDKVTLELETGNYQLIIYDASGKLILSKQITDNHTEEISMLPKGSYVLRVRNLDNDDLFTKQLIKL